MKGRESGSASYHERIQFPSLMGGYGEMMRCLSDRGDPVAEAIFNAHIYRDVSSRDFPQPASSSSWFVSTEHEGWFSRVS